MRVIKEMLFDGTNEEFRLIVESYQLLLYSVVYAVSPYADADDIVQETFIYAYYHWGMLREKENLSAWLCAIAKNKAARVMRKAGKTVSIENIGDKIAVSSPETAFLHHEQRMEIREKISALSEKYRETVMLYYFAEKSISEIAALLEIPEGTVKFRLHEGRKQLKKELLHLMDKEKKQVKEKRILEKIKKELYRAKEAYGAYQKGESLAICDELITQFENMGLSAVSKEEIRMMMQVYSQKFCANKKIEPITKNILNIEKTVELAEFLKDERLMLDRYVFYAVELMNLRQFKKSAEYYEKALILAEKLGDTPQIAKLNYHIGSMYVLSNDDRDVRKAKAYFEKAVSYKEELLKSDYGKHIYALVYGAFIGMSRVNKLDQLNGFFTASPNLIKTNGTLKTQIYPGFFAVRHQTYFMFDVFAHMTRMEPFLSNHLIEGYHFESNSYLQSEIPVCARRYEVISINARAETPAGMFEDCLHIRYTERTEYKCNFDRCGIHDIFYAPKVGLVQMYFRSISGIEYTVKLTKYEVIPIENGDLCDRYLPLTVGNVWYYEPYGAAVERFQKEEYESRYEVVAKRKNDSVTNHWLPTPKIETKGEDDIITSISHSGFLIKK